MIALLLQQSPLPEPHMTSAGWIFMLAAWICVLGLVLWCFAKVIWGGKPS